MLSSPTPDIAGRSPAGILESAADWHWRALDPCLRDLHGARFPNAEDAAPVVLFTLA